MQELVYWEHFSETYYRGKEEYYFKLLPAIGGLFRSKYTTPGQYLTANVIETGLKMIADFF